MTTIVFIGYRCVGKTQTSKLVAKTLGKDYLSTDAQFEKKYGSIKSFVKKHGWSAFRKKESAILRRIKTTNTVIDCGGGIVESFQNRKQLKKLGVVVWLKASPSTIKKRMKTSMQRPALTKNSSAQDEIEQVLRKREPLYKQLAHVTIETDQQTPQKVAQYLAQLHTTKLCVSLTAPTVREMIRHIKNTRLADVIELRLDSLSSCSSQDLQRLLSTCIKPVLVTCRPCSKRTEKQRIHLLKKAIQLNADYVDIESDTKISTIKQLIKQKNNTHIIISHHNFTRTPSLKQLQRTYTTITSLRPDFIKIITMATSINDNFTLFSLLQNKLDLISFCMGPQGIVSRILAPVVGSRLTYARSNNGQEAAPGQLSVEDMQSLYRLPALTEKTTVFGVVAQDASHSLSLTIHNALYRKHKDNAVYLPLSVSPKELSIFLKNVKQWGWKGLSVTNPHKTAMIPLSDTVDTIAKTIGASNTLTIQNKRVQSTNTDWKGVVRALEEHVSLSKKKILVIGAGGAARAVVYGLKEKKSQITITNRTAKKCRELCSLFSCTSIPFTQINKEASSYDIIINTINTGQQESLIKPSSFDSSTIVMDITYHPLQTPLLKAASQQGCTIITGERMLIHQAAEQYKIWMHKTPHQPTIEKAVYQKLGEQP